MPEWLGNSGTGTVQTLGKDTQEGFLICRSDQAGSSRFLWVTTAVWSRKAWVGNIYSWAWFEGVHSWCLRPDLGFLSRLLSAALLSKTHAAISVSFFFSPNFGPGIQSKLVIQSVRQEKDQHLQKDPFRGAQLSIIWIDCRGSTLLWLLETLDTCLGMIFCFWVVYLRRIPALP